MSTSTSLVKFEAWTDEQAAAADSEVEDLTAGEFAKIPTGRSTWRVMPSTTKGVAPLVHVMEHFIKAPGGKSVRFVCPRHMAKRPCPACRKAAELRATGHPVDYEEAGKYMPRLRAYCNAVQREHQDAGPKVLAVSKTVYNDLRAIRTEHGDYTHPTEGFDIVINRVGTKMEDTTYKVRESRENSPLHEDSTVVGQWIEMTKDLRQYTRVPTEDELSEMGIVSARRGRADDDEPAEKPARRRAPAPRTAAADDADEGRPAARRKPEPRERTVEDDVLEEPAGEPLDGELIEDDDDLL